MNTLQPEYRGAMETILRELPARHHGDLSSDVYRHDAIGLYKKEIKPGQLPCENEWRWNQSRAKRSVPLSGGGRASLVKVVPRWRKAPTRGKVPSYKLWICTFHHPSGEKESVTWCEKGKERSFPEPHLEDYEFLAPWMPEALADEFWPSRRRTPHRTIAFNDCLFRFDAQNL